MARHEFGMMKIAPQPEKGLAYCGVTLIPPQSLTSFVNVIRHLPGLSSLTALAELSQKESKWIIHYGL